MSRFWWVDKALEDSEGLRWIRERLGAYDWSTAVFTRRHGSGVLGSWWVSLLSSIPHTC